MELELVLRPDSPSVRLDVPGSWKSDLELHSPTGIGMVLDAPTDMSGEVPGGISMELHPGEPDLVFGSVSDAVMVSDIPAFGGPYEVVPTLPGFEVPTSGKRMLDDMSVKPIPVNRASNASGGYTCTIG